MTVIKNFLRYCLLFKCLAIRVEKKRNCVRGLNDSVWEYVKLIKVITNRMAYSKHIYTCLLLQHIPISSTL